MGIKMKKIITNSVGEFCHSPFFIFAKMYHISLFKYPQTLTSGLIYFPETPVFQRPLRADTLCVIPRTRIFG